MNIVWQDLPKPRGAFTRRSTMMVTLDTKRAIQLYSPNTKLNVVQYTMFNDSIYFRTQSAKDRNLNWAIKADAFSLPDGYLASLAPSNSPAREKVSHQPSSLKLPKQKPAPKATPSNNEGKVSASKINLFKRFIDRMKKEKK